MVLCVLDNDEVDVRNHLGEVMESPHDLVSQDLIALFVHLTISRYWRANYAEEQEYGEFVDFGGEA